MEKDDYNIKMMNLLEDPDAYEIMDRDPTRKLQEKSNNLIKGMRFHGYIDEDLCKSLCQHNALPPRIYVLPKIHKPEFPLRPIVASIKSPTYFLSKFSADILNNIRDDRLNIRSSQCLPAMLSQVILEEADEFVSFDVVAMFTNVMTDLALGIIEKRWNDLKIFAPLPKRLFFKTLEHCLNNSYFKHNDRYYKQKAGLAMGSPLSAIVSELVLDELFNKLRDQFWEGIKFLVKYVDDSLLIIRSSIFNDVFSCLNNFHSRLKFTFERDHNCMNFLDTSFIRGEKNRVIYRYYKKPTYTGRIYSFPL